MQPFMLALAQRSAHMHCYTPSFPLPFLLVLDQIWSWGLALAHIPSLFFSVQLILAEGKSWSYCNQVVTSSTSPKILRGPKLSTLSVPGITKPHSADVCWVAVYIYFLKNVRVPPSCSSGRHLSLLQTAQEGWVCSWKAGWTRGLACLGLIVTKLLCKIGFVLTIASLGFAGIKTSPRHNAEEMPNSVLNIQAIGCKVATTVLSLYRLCCQTVEWFLVVPKQELFWSFTMSL